MDKQEGNSLWDNKLVLTSIAVTIVTFAVYLYLESKKR